MQNFLLFLLCRLTDLYYICWKESFNKEIMQLIDGKAISEQVKQEIAAEVAEIVAKGGKRPHLAAILVGHDGGSETYVAAKVKACEVCGFKSSLIRYEADVTEEELLAKVRELNEDADVDGFIVQLPLPKHISEQKVIETIDYRKDVDGFHPINVGRMSIGLPCYVSATPNGILELLELIGEQKTALRIRHLFLPVWMKGSEKENPFILAAQKAGIMVEYLKKGDEIRAGELTVSVLHPGAGEDYTGEENAGSVVLQLSCGACRALLTGDLEGSGEEEVLGAAERCQILKVAHHGSRNSTSEAFLNRIQPQISLISCAWPGRYGHPHRELLERLRACKSHIYGTPVDGAVTVQLKRDRLAVHGYRSDVEFPVS